MHRATVDSPVMRIRNLTAAGLLGALLLPAAADAATKPVFRGPPPKGQLKGVKGPAFDSSFYPNRLTLRAGDKIKLTTLGFGDTIFVPKGQKAPAFAVPNPDAPVAGAKDAAGADYDPNVKPAYAFNLDEAKKLLLDAGKELGFGPDRPKDLVIIYNAAAPWQGYIATQVASNINGLNAGLKLDVKALSFTEYVNSWRSALTGFSIHSTFSLTADPNSWLSAFGTSAGFWARTSSYDNPKADALYTRQFQALDPKQRAKLISEMVQLVNDDVMWVWIGAATAYGQPTFNPNVLRASVKGFYYNPTYQGFYFPALWKE